VEHATETKQDARLDRIVLDAQEELAALRRELARYRGLFDSARLIVGHEFARPLTSLSGYLELAEERLGAAADEKERAYFSKMRNSIDRLEGLVESFIQMLRAEQGAGDLQTLERIDIAGLVERVRERFDESASLIETHVECPLPSVLVRRRCLEVVLENLVSNAIKHGGTPVRVTASLARERRGEARNAILVLTVEDRGTGIPEDKLEAVFAPFFRLENGGHKTGLGLGLAVVKSIVAIMNGEIRLRSKPGEGTVVTVVIPVPNDIKTLSDTVG
jgi:signal transduction histidine kinase